MSFFHDLLWADVRNFILRRLDVSYQDFSETIFGCIEALKNEFPMKGQVINTSRNVATLFCFLTVSQAQCCQ